MKTSDEGLRLNKSFEGYHRRLENGDCTAYQTYLGGGKYDIPTIGYGTTKNVHMGMVLTEAQATERMMEDLAAAEAAVTQCVTVPINQNQFDALVLFTNNCGSGNLKKLVAPLNKGDAEGTAKKFPLYNRAQGRVLAGLISRRAREQALFLKPVEAPAEPAMPQTVTASREPPSAKTVATVAATTTATITQLLPVDPLGTAEQVVTTGSRVQNVAQTGHAVSVWALSVASWPYLLAAAAAGFGLYWLICHYLPSKQEAPS